MGSTTISGLLKNIGTVVDEMDQGSWQGIEVTENRVKVLVALLKYINRHWNPSTPKGKTIKEAADLLIKNKLCNGVIKQAIEAPPPQSVVTPLKIYKKNVSVGCLRIQLIHFFSFTTFVRFLDCYVQDII